MGKRSGILFVGIIFTASLCGCRSLSDKKYNLATAIEEAGSNYTISACDYSGESSSVVVGSAFICRHSDGNPATGYVYLKSDSRSVHSFSYTDDENSVVDFGIREDISYASLQARQKMSAYLNVEDFEQKAKGVYFTEDEAAISKFLSLVYDGKSIYDSTDFGKDGLAVFMNKENTISKIEVYGFSSVVKDPPEDDVWLTLTVSDIGTSIDEKLSSIIKSSTYHPTPEYSYLKYRYSEKKTARYDGETMDFNGFCIASVFGENGENGLTVADASGLGFYIPGDECADILSAVAGTTSIEEGREIQFTASVATSHGATVLKSVKEITVSESTIATSESQEMNVDSYVENRNQGTLYLYNGNHMDFTSLVFDSYSVDPDSERYSIDLHYEGTEENYSISAASSENASAGQKEALNAFFGNLEQGDKINILNATIIYNSDNVPTIEIAEGTTLSSVN